MKIVKVLIAIIITIALLYIARTNSEGRPKFYSHSENGYSFEMTSVPKGLENGKVEIELKIVGEFNEAVKPVLKLMKFAQDKNTALVRYATFPTVKLKDSVNNIYSTEIATGSKGRKTYYYFGIRDNTGGMRAKFTKAENTPFDLKFIGEIPNLILYSHIFFLFAAVYCAVLGSIQAVSVIRDGSNMGSMAFMFFLAAVFTFFGCYPSGFAMNYYAFGGIWEGVPFGTDATDNKTQLIFVYLLMINLITLGTLSKGKCASDIYSAKTRGWLGLGSFIVVLTMYLIPHSIQFDPTQTKIVCYSFVGLMLLIYSFGLLTGKKYPYTSES